LTVAGFAVGDSLDVEDGVAAHPKTNTARNRILKRRNAGEYNVRDYVLETTRSLPKRIMLSRDAGLKHVLGLWLLRHGLGCGTRLGLGLIGLGLSSWLAFRLACADGGGESGLCRWRLETCLA
jgi:hypothetical protein